MTIYRNIGTSKYRNIETKKALTLSAFLLYTLYFILFTKDFPSPYRGSIYKFLRLVRHKLPHHKPR